MLNRHRFFLLLILTCALFARLIGIVGRDLYCDEAVVMLYSKMSWERLLQILPHENYGPLWFIIQKLWNNADGYVWARLLAVAFGVALVAIGFGAGMNIGGINLAITSGFIMATNCYLVSFSQKVWSYIPCTTFIMLALFSAMRLSSIHKSDKCNSRLGYSASNDGTPQKRKATIHIALMFLTYCIAALLAFYTHYISLPPLLAISIICAIYLRRSNPMLLIWCAAQLAIAIAMLPWIRFMLIRASSVAHGFHMGYVSLFGVLDVLHDFSAFAPSARHSAIHARIVTIAGALLFSYLLLRALWGVIKGQTDAFTTSFFCLSTAIWMAVALFLPVWHPRTLLPLAPAYCIMLSQAIVSHRRKLTIAFFSLTLSLNIVSLLFYFSDKAYAEAEWRRAATYLKERRHQEPVVHTSELSFAPIAYHLGSTDGHMVLGLTRQAATAATNFVFLIEPNASLSSIEELLQQTNKFWLVETTDWRPWVSWEESAVVKEVRKRANVKSMLKLRGVNIYLCEFKVGQTDAKNNQKLHSRCRFTAVDDIHPKTVTKNK